MHAYDEISLLVFTLLAQMAVGIVLVGQFAMAGGTGEIEKSRIQKQGFYAFLFVIAAGLISCFHLGTPFHAPFSIFNLSSSWLSREILLVLLTIAAMGVMIYFCYKDPDSSWVRIFAIISSLTGLLLLYAMSRVYASPFMPNWDNSSTFFLFLASALLLGALWQAFALDTIKKEAEDKNALLWRIFFMALCGFALIAIFVPIGLPEPNPLINPVSEESTLAQIISAQSLHTFLAGIGILLFLIALWRSMKNKASAFWLLIGFLFVLAGEIIGRYAFYMSYGRLGM